MTMISTEQYLSLDFSGEEKYVSIFKQYNGDLLSRVSAVGWLAMETVKDGTTMAGYRMMAGISDLGARLKLCSSDLSTKYSRLTAVTKEMVMKNVGAMVSPSRFAIEHNFRQVMLDTLGLINKTITKKLAVAGSSGGYDAYVKQMAEMMYLHREAVKLIEDSTKELDAEGVEQFLLAHRLGVDKDSFVKMIILSDLCRELEMTLPQELREDLSYISEALLKALQDEKVVLQERQTINEQLRLVCAVLIDLFCDHFVEKIGVLDDTVVAEEVSVVALSQPLLAPVEERNSSQGEPSKVSCGGSEPQSGGRERIEG